MVFISNFHLLQLWFKQYCLFCWNILCASFVLLFYSCSFFSVISVNHCVVISLLSSNNIWHSSSYQIFVCDLSYFPIIFPPTSQQNKKGYKILFYFVPIIISSTSSNWVFCVFAVTSLMNTSFTFLLFYLPISHFFISLFLVFSLFLMLNIILALTEKWSHSISAPGYIFCCQVIAMFPCECPYVDTMFPSHLNLFPVKNLPFVFHCHLFCCEGCDPHMLDINRTLFFPTLALKSPSIVCMS